MAFKTAPRMGKSSGITKKMRDELDERLERASKTAPDKQLVETDAKAVPRAKYKIQIYFGPGRTLNGPNVVEVMVWESGNKLHGGGDELMFICKDMEDNSLGCGAFIPGDAIRNGVAVCPKCQRAINQTRLSERLHAKFSTRKLSQELAKIWHQLEGKAEFYCKFDQQDIRYLAMVKRLGAKKARELRGLHIYPYHRLIRDTGAGASLEGRIYAFLTA